MSVNTLNLCPPGMAKGQVGRTREELLQQELPLPRHHGDDCGHAVPTAGAAQSFGVYSI